MLLVDLVIMSDPQEATTLSLLPTTLVRGLSLEDAHTVKGILEGVGLKMQTANPRQEKRPD